MVQSEVTRSRLRVVRRRTHVDCQSNVPSSCRVVSLRKGPFPHIRLLAEKSCVLQKNVVLFQKNLDLLVLHSDSVVLPFMWLDSASAQWEEPTFQYVGPTFHIKQKVGIILSPFTICRERSWTCCKRMLTGIGISILVSSICSASQTLRITWTVRTTKLTCYPLTNFNAIISQHG